MDHIMYKISLKIAFRENYERMKEPATSIRQSKSANGVNNVCRDCDLDVFREKEGTFISYK